MELNECITIAKDILVAFAAVVTTYVAFTGLNKWRDELKGKVYFDTSRDLIRIVYKYRDYMSYARNSFITANEFPKDYNPLNSDAKVKADAYVYIYQNRLSPLVEVAQELDLYTLEAEAIWGEDIKKKCTNLRKTFFRLQRSIQIYIEDISSNNENLKII